MDIGERWAYRARALDPLVQAEVRRIGAKKPPRVLIRFVDSGFEGREEWVPRGRLKVPWREVNDFIARERRWEALHELMPARGTPEVDAADVVFEKLVDPAVASLEDSYRPSPYLAVRDVDALAALAAVEPNVLRSAPPAFVEDDVLIAPWPVAEMIAQQAAARSPEPILEYVEAKERTAQTRAIHGERLAFGRGRSGYLSPEQCAEWDAEHDRPVRDILRAWCGTEASDRHDELLALRKEVRRIGLLAEEAIRLLRAAGQERDAQRLHRNLGVPVEVLPDTSDR